MPLKTNRQTNTKKYPRHYSKVYWPYIPLIILVCTGLWLGHPVAERSQPGVLAYATHVSAPNLLSGTNQARQKDGKAALQQNASLAAAAQAKAQDMVARNYWSHLTPDGKTPWTFIDSTGFVYQKAGENLAYGFAASDDVITGWLNSPAHRENMLDGNYQDIGFGIATSSNYQDNGPETIVVALYATPGASPAAVNTSSSVAAAAFTSTNPVAREASKTISRAQTLTGGRTPWIGFALGLTSGTALAYVLFKNSLLIHRKIRRGEHFVLKHPILDLTIIAFVALCALLSQSAGLIR